MMAEVQMFELVDRVVHKKTSGHELEIRFLSRRNIYIHDFYQRHLYICV
jgi:hypothetical protein